MRILLVSHRYSPDIGGIEEVVGQHARILVEKGNDVRVITTSKDRGMIGEREEEGVKINRFACFSPNDAYFFSGKMGRYVGAIAEEYDIIHAHNYHAFPALHAFRNRRTKPFVLSAHYHGGSNSKLRNLLLGPYKLLSRKMVEGSDAIVCVSESEKNILERDFRLPETYVNHNAVEVEGFELGQKKDEICVVGRLEKYKNVDKVILALEEAKLEGIRDLTLNIIGDGPDKKRLEGIVSKRGLSESVVFHGFVSEEEKGSIIGSCSCLLTLSSHESFGITIIEAAKHGLRVIASEIPPHRELATILGEGVSLVNPRNVSGTAELIIDCINNKKRPVFDNIVDFSWERNIERLSRIYEQTITDFRERNKG